MKNYIIEQEINSPNEATRREWEYLTHTKHFSKREFDTMCEIAIMRASDDDVVSVAQFLCREYGFELINDSVCQYHQYE